MTYRERRLAKAQRLREWADKRDAKAQQHSASAAEHIEATPLGQPVHLGHHSERRALAARERFARNMDKSIEHSDKAEEMRQRAENIESAASQAIYSDDDDAIERLEEKIANLEETRASIRLFNASCRKGGPDFSLLNDEMKKEHASLKSIGRGIISSKEEFPPYKCANLSGKISRYKKRLEVLKRKSKEMTK